MKWLVILFPLFLAGQTQYKYCELVGYQKPLSNKLIVMVDTGETRSWWESFKTLTDTIAPEYRNEKVYITTDAALYEGKQVMSDARGKFIWQKVQVNKAEQSRPKPAVFSSMVGGMNYMGERGWEFVQAYSGSHQNGNTYHYILRRKK